MNVQPALFYEDIFDVARAMVQATGGAKVVAGQLWPHMAAIEAQRKLLDCLNRERPEKLDLEEFLAIVRLARVAGFHQGKHWIDMECGYQPTQPADPRIERDRLAEELANAADAFRTLTRAAERLIEQPPGVRAVK